MAVSVGIAVVLSLYVLFMGFTFWFCVIADPQVSPTAKFVSHTLPSEFMKLAGKMVGAGGVRIIEVFMERLLAIIYLTVICGGFSLLHAHGYPWAKESEHIPDYHLRIGYGVLFMALATWRWTMTTSPGIITPETVHFYDHFPYDDLLYLEGKIDGKRGIPRLPRSKYDRLKHHQHVARFDHYCGWVAGTIGEENYRLFLFFVFTQFAMCVYGTVMLTRLFMGEIEDRKLFEVTFFDKASGQEYPANKWIVFQYLFHRHLYEAGILAIMGVMAVALFFFLGFHIYITSRGMTTNEQYKWGQVRQWHKEQVKKYEQYKRNLAGSENENLHKLGVKPNGSTQQEEDLNPHILDGDVTCTGGTKTPQVGDSILTDEAQLTSLVIEDPGPMPQNIYNRGFIQNWKEVLFPISLQRKADAAASAKSDKKMS